MCVATWRRDLLRAKDDRDALVAQGQSANVMGRSSGAVGPQRSSCFSPATLVT